MKLAVLFSGGKDSCLALYKVLQGGDDVRYLLNVFPKNNDSFMFHKPDLDLLGRQAVELGIDLIVKESEGEKEEELGDLKELIEKISGEIEGIVVGGIASSYQGERIKKICDDLNLKFIAPLWDYYSEKVWQELLEGEFEVVLTKIACDGLGMEWIGRVIDKDALTALKVIAEKKKFRIDFEGGEAESAVLFMPGFTNKIKLDFEVFSEGEHRHFMKIKEIK